MTTETTTVEREGLALVPQARGLVVRTADEYAAAGAFVTTRVKPYLRKVDELCDPVKKATHAAWEAACEQKKVLTQPALEAEKIAKAGMVAWETAERQRAAEAQRLADAAARKEAEARQLEEAAAAEAAGDHAAAEAIVAAPTFVPPVVVAPVIPKVAGIARRETWSAKVTDLAALVRAVANGQAPLTALDANMTVLNGLARSMQSQMRIPGVTAFPTSGIGAGAR